MGDEGCVGTFGRPRTAAVSKASRSGLNDSVTSGVFQRDGVAKLLRLVFGTAAVRSRGGPISMRVVFAGKGLFAYFPACH